MVDVTDEAGLNAAIAAINGTTIAGSYTIKITDTITEDRRPQDMHSLRRHISDPRSSDS
jgi:hypothetical protein